GAAKAPSSTLPRRQPQAASPRSATLCWTRVTGSFRRRLAPGGSAIAGSEVVGKPGPQTRPLGGGTSIATQRVHIVPLRPARRRVLPRLLTSVDGQVEQPVAVIHR